MLPGTAISLLLSSLLLTACVTAPPAILLSDLTPTVLLRAEPLTGPENPAPIDDIDLLKLSPEMLEFLETNVYSNINRMKLNNLLAAIISNATFGLEFDDVTRTAEETFERRLGNCLSFTSMFVALARQVGLTASYQEVDVPPEWTHEGGVFVLSRHVNVHIDLGKRGIQVVDFNIENFRTSYDRRVVSDRRASAHYYNNVGVERMQAGQTSESVRYFRKAIDQDYDFGPAWNNLGTLYSQSGHPLYAEAAYLQALEVNPREFVAMSNLVKLYERTDQLEQATQYRRQAMIHRIRNPYYRYHLARQAFFARDFDTAIRHLKFATDKKENEDTFYFLLGLSYLQKGDKAAARQWLAKAEEVAEDTAQQSKYHDKLEMLLSAQN